MIALPIGRLDIAVFNLSTGRPRVAKPAPYFLADAAVLERAAVVELHLQDTGACIVADGAQFARIDLFYFHGGITRECVGEVLM